MLLREYIGELRAELAGAYAELDAQRARWLDSYADGYDAGYDAGLQRLRQS